MSRDNTGECKGCHAPMRWAITDNGKGVPLDPDPVPEGKLVFEGETTADGRMVVRYVRKGEDVGIHPRYDTHFATCPEADSFRRDR